MTGIEVYFTVPMTLYLFNYCSLIYAVEQQNVGTYLLPLSFVLNAYFKLLKMDTISTVIPQ